MPSIVTNVEEGRAWIRRVTEEVTWRNHRDLITRLLSLCDECLLVSPFLASDFEALFGQVDVSSTSAELISTCAPHGDDQLSKPYSLRSFGRFLKGREGNWPTIGLDQKLHSKVYSFRVGGRPIGAIITSANLTEAGLIKNHETGVLLEDPDTIDEIERRCRNSLDYVHLSEWQVDKLCQTADIMSRDYRPSENREIGLKSILNLYAAPSAGNRDTTLRPGSEYYVKVSGVKDRPILPEHREDWAEPHSQLTFAKEPRGIALGDCLLEVAVGGACFLSYYACASAVREFSDEEKATNPDHKRWPYYIYANNLSLNYASTWYEDPLFYDRVVEDFKKDNPGVPVTAAGSDHFKGAMQMGHSYIKLTKEFGEYARRRMDAYRTNQGMQRTQ